MLPRVVWNVWFNERSEFIIYFIQIFKNWKDLRDEIKNACVVSANNVEFQELCNCV